MRKRKLMTVMLAAVLALSLAACGGEKKPVDTTDTTDTSQTDTSQTDSSQADSSQIDSSQTDTSQTEKEQPEAESAEAETKIPENATEILLTNPKIQAQAKFYFPKEAKEWETKCLSKRDPVNVPQRYVYQSENADGVSLRADIRLTATLTATLAAMLENEEAEKIQVQNYPAILETTNTSWQYTIDLGPFTEGLNLYINASFEGGNEEFANIKELADVQDMFLETLTVTTDYEGKEDRSGRKYQGVGLCSLPDTMEYHGENVEVMQVLDEYHIYSLKTEVYDSDPIPTRVTAMISGTINNASLEMEGYQEYTIAGYSGIMKQTEFYGYVSSFLRLKINEGTNYDVYAITYVNDDELTDPVALAAAVKEMKDDPDTYYQKSLELLEAMLTAAEFREPVEAWFE